MFSSMLREHQRAQEELKEKVNNKRIAAEKAVEVLSANTVKELNEGIAQAYVNQHKLDSETRKLQANISKLAKNSDQWVKTCKGLNEAVKDLGDISTWTRAIERDIKFIANAVEESHRPIKEDK